MNPKRLPYRTLRIFGIVTVVLWLSFCIYLPPVAPKPKVKEFVAQVEQTPQELRKLAPAVNKPSAELEAQLRAELLNIYILLLFVIIVGVTSGLLLLARRRIGRVLAIILCSVMLLVRAVGLVESHPRSLDQFVGTYIVMLKHFPVHLLHGELFAVLFAIFSIVFLTRKGVSEQFGAAQKIT
jgi:hypothetical protein